MIDGNCYASYKTLADQKGAQVTRRPVYACISVLIIIAVYTGLWCLASQQVKTALPRQLEAWAADGWVVEIADLQVRGFPFSLTIDSAIVSAVNHRLDNPREFMARDVTGRAYPWNLDHWRVTVSGPINAEWGPPEGKISVSAWSQQVHAILEFRAGTLSKTEIDLFETDWSLQGEPIATSSEFQVALGKTGRSAPLNAALRMSDLSFAKDRGGAFGDDIHWIQFKSTVLGKIPDDFTRDKVGAWRDDGGTIEVSDLSLLWGTLDLAAAGTVTLDESFQPLGAFSARIKGLDEAVTEMAAAEIISREIALAVSLAIAFLKQPAPEGGTVVDIAISAQDGLLYLGPVALLTIPPVY